MSGVTRILHATEWGDLRAVDEFLPLVYEEPRMPVLQKLSYESPGQTLRATAPAMESVCVSLVRRAGIGEAVGNSSRLPQYKPKPPVPYEAIRFTFGAASAPLRPAS